MFLNFSKGIIIMEIWKDFLRAWIHKIYTFEPHYCSIQKRNISKLLKQIIVITISGFITSLYFTFTGSPAEKADLEVADEILEINGQSLENSSHTDIIAHIHNVSWYIYENTHPIEKTLLI